MTDCPSCKSRDGNHHGIFDIKCPDCRTSIALSEPCKIVRAYVVESMEKWGATEGWKAEPHCGCGKTCKRKANLKQV